MKQVANISIIMWIVVFLANVETVLLGAQGVPRQVLENSLEKREDIREEDKSALREVVSWIENEGGSIKYNDLSEFRKSALNKKIEVVVGSFPTQEYDTLLQRQAKIENFRMHARTYFETPFFSINDRAGVDNQIGTIINLSMGKIRKGHPVIIGTEAEPEIERLLRRRFEGSRDNDMTPVLKIPLGPKKFTEACDIVKVDMHVLDKDEKGFGHVTPNWNKLSKIEQANYLERNAGLIARSILGAFNKHVSRICDIYSLEAMETVFSDLNKPIAISPKDVKSLRDLNVAANEEGKRIREEEAEKWRKENKHERLMDQIGDEVPKEVIESVIMDNMDNIESELKNKEVEPYRLSYTNELNNSQKSNGPNQASLPQDTDARSNKDTTASLGGGLKSKRVGGALIVITVGIILIVFFMHHHRAKKKE